MTEHTHGRLVPVSKAPDDPDGPTLWRCIDCGEVGRSDGLTLEVEKAKAS